MKMKQTLIFIPDCKSSGGVMQISNNELFPNKQYEMLSSDFTFPLAPKKQGFLVF